VRERLTWNCWSCQQPFPVTPAEWWTATVCPDCRKKAEQAARQAEGYPCIHCGDPVDPTDPFADECFRCEKKLNQKVQVAEGTRANIPDGWFRTGREPEVEP
jgi:DNA-directed RNA polymerase subunit RPC12/RpoP